MLILNGNNLGERQKELNIKVKEAVTSKIDFEQIKDKTEQSDVDKLFKIDLASKYKDIDYIMEVFKSGDSLHISRALKCTWIYDDEFSHLINMENLQHNILPFMSLKMKKKLLFTISTHVRNEERAISFYNYCMAVRMKHMARQFAIFTSENLKLDLIKNNVIRMRDLSYKGSTKHFVGHSFTLAEALVAKNLDETCSVFQMLSYLYSVSDEKYLDMLENHLSIGCYNSLRLGLRISKDIITKHKNRVLAKPDVYIKFLNQKCIVRHSSVENVKIYLVGLLPNDVREYWGGCRNGFCSTFEFILNILPHEDRFEFIKKIFLDKYPDQQFEMTSEFHSRDYCRFMTKEQKEKWALDHIASQKEILGIGNDYKWYKYISFEIAFDAIKKLVMITPDSNERSEMLHILVKSAKSQRELEKLFKYFYERHNNELRHIRQNFMAEAASVHNVFEFDKDCWNAFNKIYENLYVYSLLESSRNEFRAIALIYHVINKFDVHKALNLYIDKEISFYKLKQNTDRLPKEKQDMVYQYLFHFFMAKINDFDCMPYCDDTKYKIRKYIFNMLDLLHKYDRSKKDIPEIVMKFIKVDWEEFKCHRLLEEPKTEEVTQDNLIRLLKKDAKLLVEKLPLVKKTIENSYTFHLGLLLKKLRVYFSNDIAKECLKMFSEILTAPQINSKVARAACHGIFHLAEDTFKVDFMTKHAPTQSKINRGEMNESLLNIQEAICATAFYSRPPVPLKTMFLYVKGDYVPCCLPMFNSYLVNLPPALCKNFIESLLNNPLSVQKHGIRFAFTCFNAENIRNLVLKVWKKTKNVSLRRIIYKALYDKIGQVDLNAQTILFETLRKLTLELNQDDDQEIFSLIISMRVPMQFKSDYIDAAWTTVSAFENNNINLERKADVISCMFSNIQSIQQDIIQPIVENFVKEEINTEELLTSLEPNRLYEHKWELAAYFIMYVKNRVDLHIRLELTKLILKYCLSSYNLVVDNQYKIRKFTVHFIRNLLFLSFSEELETYQYTNEILETVFEMLLDALSVKDIYMILWAIRFNILARNAIIDINSQAPESKDDSEKLDLVKGEILKFGTQVGFLISDFISKNMYLKIFLPNIVTEFEDNVRHMYFSIQRFSINVDTNDLLVVTSAALMKFKATEIYLFVLNVLPITYCQHYEQDYKFVLEELKDVEDLEISCKMYDRYVYTDFKRREFLEL